MVDELSGFVKSYWDEDLLRRMKGVVEGGLLLKNVLLGGEVLRKMTFEISLVLVSSLGFLIQRLRSWILDKMIYQIVV